MRRFYGFNSRELVESHIAQVRSVDDLKQLAWDIKASGTNLTRFVNSSIEGIYAVDYAEVGEGLRYLFMTQDAYNEWGLTDEERSNVTDFKILD